jgi:MFS family permease
VGPAGQDDWPHNAEYALSPVCNAQLVRPELGLRRNWYQFSLFTLITLLIGMTIGVERVALPPLAHDAFGITSVLYTVSFISAFGAVKSVMNLVSGRLSDRHGRKMLLLAGWGFAVPFVLLIIFAQAWWWVVVANLFLGASQALTWTMSVDRQDRPGWPGQPGPRGRHR